MFPPIEHSIQILLLIFNIFIVDDGEHVVRKLLRVWSHIVMSHHDVLVFGAHIRLVVDLRVIVHILVPKYPILVVELIGLRAPAPGFLGLLCFILPNQVVDKFRPVWVCLLLPRVDGRVLSLNVVHLLQVLVVLSFCLPLILRGPSVFNNIFLPQDLLLVDKQIRNRLVRASHA